VWSGPLRAAKAVGLWAPFLSATIVQRPRACGLFVGRSPLGKGSCAAFQVKGFAQPKPKGTTIMKLDHLDLSQLKVSALNVRKHGADDVAGLVQSIRALGVLQPLLVRADEDGFEVVAGQRRYNACQLLNAEGVLFPIPCAIMEEGDDAAAIEASLAENIERLPMDELDQYEAFAALVSAGRSVDDIASHFGVTERLVKQRLALANLDKRILDLFRKDEIGGDTMRALTMATKAQQKAWLKRYRDPQDYAPHGYQLRKWLLGGEEISTSVALFDLETYKGAIVSDLFGENAYFSDPATFWPLQKQGIEMKAEAYKEAGWSEVVILDNQSYWPEYEYRKTSKKKGGKVFVSVANNGEVAFHEGYITVKEEKQKEAKASKGQGISSAAEKPELTKAAQNYVDLHRHAAVQMALIGAPAMALRVICAHMIAGSSLWTLRPDPRRADKPDTKSSLETAPAYHQFEAERAEVLALLGFDADEVAVLVDHSWQGRSMEDVFNAVMTLDDQSVLRVLSFAMAETLQVASPVIDRLGIELGVDMAQVWKADEAFLDLVVSKSTLARMLEDVGGAVAADAHKASTSKVMRRVIAQFVKGEERQKAEGWVPPQMAFPASTYADEHPELPSSMAA
jgi:ParB family chromosome partitioning protein